MCLVGFLIVFLVRTPVTKPEMPKLSALEAGEVLGLALAAHTTKVHVASFDSLDSCTALIRSPCCHLLNIILPLNPK